MAYSRNSGVTIVVKTPSQGKRTGRRKKTSKTKLRKSL